MTRAFYLSGRPGPLQTVLRTFFVITAAIGGVFVLAASAAFAFFVAAGLVILGALTFAFFWLRAKLFGRPFGPQAQFKKAQAEMEAAFKSQHTSAPRGDGPIIDAHRTPQGWSVED